MEQAQNLMMRLVSEWKIKLFLGSALAGVFWAGYFACARHPLFPVRVMPGLAVDRWLPFRPETAWIYLSQFVTLPLLTWLMTSRRDLLAFCKSVALVSGVGFLVFAVWPTTVERPKPTGDHSFPYDLVVLVDNPHNACPSLHAAFAVLIAGCAAHVFREWKHARLLIGATWLGSAAVLVSTLLTKQHVLLDALAGGVLGGAGYWWFARKAERR
jgi:membrane-associated phospholipid phosphatase